MIERAIEHWLTNTNERNYQIAFCHVLIQSGYKIIYISAHRPLEQGKDIIAIDENREYVAYQLKTGNINLSEWRKIKGEVMELIELPIVHPSCDKTKIHKSFLVLNGEITDEVRLQIDQINENNIRLNKGYSYLDVIDKTTLLREFVKAQGSFMPKELEDFNVFLELFLADGSDFVNKEKLFSFFNKTVFYETSMQKNEAFNSIYSSVIILSYLLNSYQNKKNYYALFEAWVILAACILRYVEKQGITKDDLGSTLDLIYQEINKILSSLKEETYQKRVFLEGNLMGDGGDIYKTRATIVLGVLAANEIFSSLRKKDYELDNQLLILIKENMNNMFFWGESAFPYFFYIIKYLELNDEYELSHSLLRTLLNTVVKLNSHSSTIGLANPYYGINEILYSVLFDIEQINFKEFTGSSYILESLIQIIARRMDKETLAQCWRKISYIQLKEFKPDNIEDIFQWRVEEGLNYSVFPKATQSWKELGNEANNMTDIPKFYNEHLGILCLYIIVCPHRINSKVITLIDKTVTKS